MKCTIPHNVLRSLVSHASKEGLRHDVGGMRASVAGETLTLTATDGHRLVRLRINHVTDAQDGDTIIPPDLIKQLGAGKANDTVTITYDRITTDITLASSAGMTVTARGFGGKYPLVDGIIPAISDLPATPVVALNPIHLAEAGKCAADVHKAMGQDPDDTGIRVRLGGGPGKPAHFTRAPSTGLYDLDIVLMPRSMEGQGEIESQLDADLKAVNAARKAQLATA